MTDRPVAQPHGKATACDQVPCRAHPVAAGANRGDISDGWGCAGIEGGLERRSRRGEGVKDRLVARLTSPAPREAARGGVEHRRDGGCVEHRSVAGAEPRFHAGGPVQGTRCSADGSDEAMADGPEDLAGRRLWRQLGEQLVDGPEPDPEVVAVVAIAEDRIEPGQLLLMSDDDPFAARQAGPQHGRVNDGRDLGVRGWGRGWRW